MELKLHRWFHGHPGGRTLIERFVSSSVQGFNASPVKRPDTHLTSVIVPVFTGRT